MTEPWPVQHRCGHRVEWDLGRKHPSGRAGFARWLAERDCTRCWWANRRDPYRQARAARTRLRQVLHVQAWERQLHMPALTGRPKAVAWARKVRHRLLTRASQPDTAIALLRCDDLHVAARRITAARWWIDHRHLDAANLAAALKSPQRQPGGRPSYRRPR